MSAEENSGDANSGSVDVKQAIGAANAFLQAVFAGQGVRDIRLEEVEFNEVPHQWQITFSFLRSIPFEEIPAPQRAIESVLGNRTKYCREYKSVVVDGQNGEAKSIKMRSVV
jgi:hypothetical protein